MLVPPDHAKAIQGLLEACRRLPYRCQAHLDAMALECAGQVAGAIKIERADCLGAAVETHIETGSMWMTWEVVLVAIGVGLAAGGVGTGIGVVVSR